MEYSNKLYVNCSIPPASKKIRIRAKESTREEPQNPPNRQGEEICQFHPLTIQPELGVTRPTREARFPWTTLHFTSNVSMYSQFISPKP